MACSPLMLCLWGQTKCPKQVLDHGNKHQKSQDHCLEMWQGTSDGDPHVATSLRAWEKESFLSPGLRQDSSPIKLSRVPPHKGLTLEHLQHESAWAGCLLLQLLHFSSVQNKAVPKCLLWLESAHPLSWSFWNAGIFQRKRKHPVLSGIFHGYTLPRGDLSLQGNFQHYVILGFFFKFYCLSLQRQADKWREK